MAEAFNIKDLHNYVKEAYESGEYEAANATYTQWQTDKEQSSTSDFDMGKMQAEHDYATTGKFKHYPEQIVKIINQLAGNKAAEIGEFIAGYNRVKRNQTK